MLDNISTTLKNSLWEYDIQKLHFSDNIVIVRALNFWEISDINLIISNIWKQKFLDIFLKNTKTDLKHFLGSRFFYSQTKSPKKFMKKRLFFLSFVKFKIMTNYFFSTFFFIFILSMIKNLGYRWFFPEFVFSWFYTDFQSFSLFSRSGGRTEDQNAKWFSNSYSAKSY